MMKTYQDVMQMIRDGADAADVEAVLADEHTPLTDAQIADLRAELARAVVDAAEQGGGIEEVRRIAARGWSGVSGDTNEAIKAEAARAVAAAR